MAPDPLFTSLLPGFLVLPLIGVFLGRLFPKFVFPAPSSKEREVAHCKQTADLSIIVIVPFCVLTWGALLLFPPSFVVSSPVLTALETSWGRIGYALQWELFATILYAIFILRVALARGSDPDAVRGNKTGVSSMVEFRSRVLNNTTEQLILASFAHLGFASVAPPLQAALITPAAVSMWITGRILYVMGYTPENPLGREVGFELTLIPSLLCLSLALFHFFI